MRRISGDAFIAAVLMAACAFLGHNLFLQEGAGAFVKTTTLPLALVAVLGLLSVVLLVSSVGKAIAGDVTTAGEAGTGLAVPLGRVAILIALMTGYIFALRHAGYLISTGVFLLFANLIFGARHRLVIVLVSLLVPVLLYLFFEKYMIILLPAARMFG